MVGLRIEADITDPSLLCPVVGLCIEADVTDPALIFLCLGPLCGLFSLEVSFH